MTFSLYKYTLFSFYKPSSIFKTKGTFYGNKFLKGGCFALFNKDCWFFKWVLTNYSKQTSDKNNQISKLLFWWLTDENINRHQQPRFPLSAVFFVMKN